jgi:hypothetical protein
MDTGINTTAAVTLLVLLLFLCLLAIVANQTGMLS